VSAHRYELPWVVTGATFGGKETDLHEGFLLISDRLKVVGWRCAPEAATHPRSRVARGLAGHRGDAAFWATAMDDEVRWLLMELARCTPGFRAMVEAAP
jgi:hypothetical protein